MPDPQTPDVNSWLEDELHQQYLHDRRTVDASWSEVFEGNGHAAGASEATPAPAPTPTRVTETRVMETRQTPTTTLAPGDQLIPLRGPALRIAENMTASLSMPVATSQRSMPVKVIDENRRSINEYRARVGKSKLSYTHLVAWGIVRALDQAPALNQAFVNTGW